MAGEKSLACPSAAADWEGAQLLGVVEGEAVAVILNESAPEPTPFSLIRLRVAGGQVVRIHDYIKTPWILDSAGAIALV